MLGRLVDDCTSVNFCFSYSLPISFLYRLYRVGGFRKKIYEKANRMRCL